MQTVTCAYNEIYFNTAVKRNELQNQEKQEENMQFSYTTFFERQNHTQYKDQLLPRVWGADTQVNRWSAGSFMALNPFFAIL